MMSAVSITPIYAYTLKSGKGVGLVGFALTDQFGSVLHRAKHKKTVRLWAERRNLMSNPSTDNPPNLGDSDIQELARAEIVERGGDEPKSGITFIVGNIEIALTSDQLRELANWADA